MLLSCVVQAGGPHAPARWEQDITLCILEVWGRVSLPVFSCFSFPSWKELSHSSLSLMTWRPELSLCTWKLAERSDYQRYFISLTRKRSF